MARIRKHRDKWQVLYRDPATKKEKSADVFTRKDLANRCKTALEYSSQTGDWIDPRLSATLYADWAEEWIATKIHLRPKTLEGYESLFNSRILPEFGPVKLRNIRAINIEQWIAAMYNDGLSSSRIRQAHGLLSSTLSAAVRSQMLRNNPASGVSLPRSQRNEMPFLTPPEIQRLADAFAPPDRVLIYTLAYTGIRQGEATALRRSSVNLLRREIIINESATDVHGRKVFGETKNRQTRIVALPGFLVPILEIHLEQVPVEPDALVFTSSASGPIDWSNFRARTWKPTLAVAGIDPRLRMHDLRHTAASILIAQGCHPKVVQEQLGHGSIVITMDRYGHLYPGDRSKVSDALDAAFASGEEATA